MTARDSSEDQPQEVSAPATDAAEPTAPARVEPNPEAFELRVAVPEDWVERPLPEWLHARGERYFAHRTARARLYRYVNVWEDGATQEMWSVYVTSPEKPDAVCVKLELALSMFERFSRPEFLSKSSLLPWRT